MAKLIEGANTHEVDVSEHRNVGALADAYSVVGRMLKVDGVPMDRGASLPDGCEVLEIIDTPAPESETKGTPSNPANATAPSETV